MSRDHGQHGRSRRCSPDTRGGDVETLELTAAKLILDEQPSEDLPEVATELLTRGVDSPALRVLAGASSRDVREARDLFFVALDELGVAVPDEQTALWLVAKDMLQHIAAGDIGAYEGASRIWSNVYWRIEREGDLRVFVGLASEWQDHPTDREVIEAEIRQAALYLLTRDRLRRWVKLEARHRESPARDPQSNRPMGLTDLPISNHLRTDLTAWAEEFDHVSASPGAGPSGFASSDEAADFVELGQRLAQSLQDELGEQWHVEYLPTPKAFP
jgi:hypothetical protein